MGRRIALADLLDRHAATCPECPSEEAYFLISDRLERYWKCVSCGHLWKAAEVPELPLEPAPRVTH